jgi:uncharacterized membrane protein
MKKKSWEKCRPSLSEITQQNVELIGMLEAAARDARSRGERVADFATAVVGSWTFLIFQFVCLIVWMALNLTVWMSHWDPYPFVLLNLVLSFQAAFATPIILMSQNRQARLDNRREKLDLQINLLAEQENTEQLRLLRMLCDKLQVDCGSSNEQAFEQAASPQEIIEQIVANMD